MYIRLYVHQGYALFISFLYGVVSMWMYHHAMLNYINKYEILRSGFAAFVCVLMSVPVNVSCTSLSLLNAQRGAGKIQAESHFPSWLIGLVRKPAVRETAWGQCTALSIYCSSHDYSLKGHTVIYCCAKEHPVLLNTSTRCCEKEENILVFNIWDSLSWYHVEQRLQFARDMLFVHL